MSSKRKCYYLYIWFGDDIALNNSIHSIDKLDKNLSLLHEWNYDVILFLMCDSDYVINKIINNINNKKVLNIIINKLHTWSLSFDNMDIIINKFLTLIITGREHNVYKALLSDILRVIGLLIINQLHLQKYSFDTKIYNLSYDVIYNILQSIKFDDINNKQTIMNLNNISIKHHIEYKMCDIPYDIMFYCDSDDIMAFNSMLYKILLSNNDDIINTDILPCKIITKMLPKNLDIINYKKINNLYLDKVNYTVKNSLIMFDFESDNKYNLLKMIIELYNNFEYFITTLLNYVNNKLIVTTLSFKDPANPKGITFDTIIKILYYCLFDNETHILNSYEFKKYILSFIVKLSGPASIYPHIYCGKFTNLICEGIGSEAQNTEILFIKIKNTLAVIFNIFLQNNILLQLLNSKKYIINNNLITLTI